MCPSEAIASILRSEASIMNSKRQTFDISHIHGVNGGSNLDQLPANAVEAMDTWVVQRKNRLGLDLGYRLASRRGLTVYLLEVYHFH